MHPQTKSLPLSASPSLRHSMGALLPLLCCCCCYCCCCCLALLLQGNHWISSNQVSSSNLHRHKHMQFQAIFFLNIVSSFLSFENFEYPNLKSWAAPARPGIISTRPCMPTFFPVCTGWARSICSCVHLASRSLVADVHVDRLASSVRRSLPDTRKPHLTCPGRHDKIRANLK